MLNQAQAAAVLGALWVVEERSGEDGCVDERLLEEAMKKLEEKTSKNS